MMSFRFNKAQEAWLQDLEKTRAKQGEGYLHDYDGWCCLGRACKVLSIENTRLIGDWADTWHSAFGEQGASGVLPREAMAKLNLYSNFGTIEGAEAFDELDGYGSLTDLNDSGGWSFKAIAKWIRAHPEEVFNNGKGA
jgi:hypothetical protein